MAGPMALTPTSCAHLEAGQGPRFTQPSVTIINVHNDIGLTNSLYEQIV